MNLKLVLSSTFLFITIVTNKSNAQQLDKPLSSKKEMQKAQQTKVHNISKPTTLNVPKTLSPKKHNPTIGGPTRGNTEKLMQIEDKSAGKKENSKSNQSDSSGQATTYEAANKEVPHQTEPAVQERNVNKSKSTPVATRPIRIDENVKTEKSESDQEKEAYLNQFKKKEVQAEETKAMK